MKKQNKFKIDIPKPCSENWENMHLSGSGRFCGNCKKTVIDFSGLPDSEILNYFSASDTIPCGRFRTTQLNRNIVSAEIKNSFLHQFLKAAAAVLVFLNMKQSVIAAEKKEPAVACHPFADKQQKLLTKDKIMITGSVTDEHSHPIGNAGISLAGNIVAQTDKKGIFSFELPEQEAGKSLLLTFNYEGLITAVRNYHPVMQSTSYNIILYSPDEASGFLMGAPIIINEESFPPVCINFNKKDKTLNKETRVALSELALRLRNHPEVSLNIIAFQEVKNLTGVGIKFQPLIKKYLIDAEGISEERLFIIVDKKSSSKSTAIEIKLRTEEF